MGYRQCALETMAINHQNFWKNRRVLITGHTGFKGSWLTYWLLTKGAYVWGYSLPLDDENWLFKKLFGDKNTLFL